MARTIAQIQASIVAAKNADATIGTSGTNPLTSTSAVAIWLVWTWVVAMAMYVTETLFDSHKAEVQGIIAGQKPHTLQWYAVMARAFQYGVALPAGSDTYAVVPPVDPTVLIISYAAAVELVNLVRIKVATLSGTSLAAITAPQLASLTTYMGQIKDAGVRLQVTSGAADTFQPTMIIYYDPLVMAADGSLISTPRSNPVRDAVNAFLNALPFNGVFVFNSFVAAMQAVPGVLIADVESVQAYYAAVPPIVINAAMPPVYVPDAGYMALDAAWFAANVSFVAY